MISICFQDKPFNITVIQVYTTTSNVEEAEVQKPWPPDTKSPHVGKEPDAGKDRKQEKGMTEDAMVG